MGDREEQRSREGVRSRQCVMGGGDRGYGDVIFCR